MSPEIPPPPRNPDLYDPYGKATVLDDYWQPVSGNESAFANDRLYAGYTRDAEESAESLLARGGESYTLTEYISQAGAMRGTRMPRFPGRRRPSC